MVAVWLWLLVLLLLLTDGAVFAVPELKSGTKMITTTTVDKNKRDTIAPATVAVAILVVGCTLLKLESTGGLLQLGEWI